MGRRSATKQSLPAEEVVEILNTNTDRDLDHKLRHYFTAARMIPLRLDVWHDIERVFLAGVANDEEVEANGYTNDEKALYDKILEAIPTLKPVIEACCGSNTKAFDIFVRKISKNALGSRTGDTHIVKENILDWIPDLNDFDIFSGDYVIGKAATREKRGWHDPRCAYLLCPVKFRDDFLRNHRAFMAGVRDCMIKVKATEFPAFLYEDPEEINPKKPLRGLLRGKLLLRAFRCLYTSPSSAFSKAAKGNSKSKAEIHGIQQVEPYGIAYAAVQVAQGLSSTSWTNKDLYFDYSVLMQRILELFETNTDSTWAQNLLAWWNKRVSFKRSSRPVSNPTDDSEDGAPSAGALLQQAEEDSEGEEADDEADGEVSPSRNRTSSPPRPSHPSNTVEQNGLDVTREAQVSRPSSPALPSSPRTLTPEQDSPPQSPQPPSAPTLTPASAPTSPSPKRTKRKLPEDDESELTPPSDDGSPKPPTPKPVHRPATRNNLKATSKKKAKNS